MKVQIHQVVAYQKYGDAIFAKGIMCRHKDNDKNNFSQDNLILGTALDNHLDNSPETLQKIRDHLKESGKKLRKLSISQADNIRSLVSSGETYSNLSKRFGISKSAISYIVNYRTYQSV